MNPQHRAYINRVIENLVPVSADAVTCLAVAQLHALMEIAETLRHLADVTRQANEPNTYTVPQVHWTDDDVERLRAAIAARSNRSDR